MFMVWYGFNCFWLFWVNSHYYVSWGKIFFYLWGICVTVRAGLGGFTRVLLVWRCGWEAAFCSGVAGFIVRVGS